MLSLKDLGDIKDILHWARMQAKTDGMYQRVVNYEKIIVNEISQESDRKLTYESGSYISRDTLKNLAKLGSYPDFRLNIEIISDEIKDEDSKEIGIAVRTTLLTVIKSAIDLRDKI